MLDFSQRTDIDNGNPTAYPDGAIKDNTGSGDGTAVNRAVYNDIYQFFLKAKRLYGITPNNLPDNETNGFQYLEAIVALASKNDFILSITSASGVLNVPVKIGAMLVGEQIVCKAAVNKGSESNIKGSDNITLSATFVGTFKANEYVRLIKTVSGITLVRLVDLVNFDTVAVENGYLKVATQTEENAGTINTKATSPLTNKTVYERRTIGVDSVNYLAVPTGAGQRNGLLSAEDKSKIDNFDSGLRNRGSIANIDVSSMTIGASLTVTGNIASAQVTVNGSGVTTIRVVFDNTMTNTNYKLIMSAQSTGGGTDASDAAVGAPSFRPINATTCDITLREFVSVTQSIKLHIDAIKL